MNVNIGIADIINVSFNLLTYIVGVIGMWNIFLKFGSKGYYALIPIANIYRISEYAGREKDGRFLMLFDFSVKIVSIVFAVIDENSTEYNILVMLLILLTICDLLYSVRVYIGICKAFEKSKLWIILWLTADWICFFIFGVFKSFRPSEEYRDVLKKAEAAELSGIVVPGGDSRLSVNLRQRSVRSFFRKFTLLRDVHLSIPTGHMVLLLGGSGAGKTTFLNAVTGYEKADADISLGSLDIYKDYKRMKYDIGFVPQQDLMRDHDTVYRTIADAASLRLPISISGRERTERIKAILNEFGLYPLKDSLVSKLSGGQRKRLSIAMEYISYPTLFILDEPDSGLDGVVARGLFEKLRSIADTNKIVMVITHTPDRVIDLFDDVIVLAKDAERTGRLAYYGPAAEAASFFGKNSMEEILLSINQVDEGGEGRADEFVRKYTNLVKTAGGEA